jgi:hypothetical protein
VTDRAAKAIAGAVALLRARDSGYRQGQRADDGDDGDDGDERV